MHYPDIAFETSFGESRQLPASDLPEVAFAGRSNVGKSSMINRLFARKNLARVSAVPGKTATINFFRLGNLRFVDLPGYGYAKVSKAEKARWRDLVGGYFAGGRDVALVFSLIDMRHPPTEDDRRMVDFLIDQEYPFVCILTKADKLSKSQRAERLAAIRGELPCGDRITFLPFSSETGEGVEKARRILDALSEEVAREAEREDDSESTEESEHL